MRSILDRLGLLSLVLAAAGLQVACTEGLASPTLLDRPRILALLADPVEPVAGRPLTVSAVTYRPDEATTRLTASFCPLSLGAVSGFACAAPACERAATIGADGSVTLDPLAETLACAERLGLAGQAQAGAPGGSPGGPADELPAKIDTHLRYTITDAAGAILDEAVLRLPLHLQGAPEPPNRAPVIQAVEADGAPLDPNGPNVLAPRTTLRVVVDPSSLDTLASPAGAAPRREEPTVAFFATAGTFDFAFAFGDDVTMGLEDDAAQPARGEQQLFVVVRDGRGAAAAAGPFAFTFSD